MAKKDHEHIYPANPYYQERYPHVHYRQQNLDYVYEQLAILKNWLESLTKLGAKLADANSEEFGDTIAEITKLTEQIQDVINSIGSTLTALNSVIDSHNSKINDGISLINNNANTIDSIISFISGSLQDVINCIETHLKKDDSYIGDINDSLKNIVKYTDNSIGDVYDYIDNSIGDTYNDLVSIINGLLSGNGNYKSVNTDSFTVTYYNGFENGNTSGESRYDAPHITCYSTEMTIGKKISHSDTVRITCSSTYVLTNSRIITADNSYGTSDSGPYFNHGHSEDGSPYTGSCVFRITWDSSAHPNWTSDNLQNGNQISTKIWNTSPNSARASWDVTCSDYEPSTYAVTLYAGSIADGYNSQYKTSYANDHDIEFGTINLSYEITYQYETDA